MNPCSLTVAITAAANVLAGQLSDGDLSLLGAAFTQLGDTLTMIATQRSICCNTDQKKLSEENADATSSDDSD